MSFDISGLGFGLGLSGYMMGNFMCKGRCVGRARHDFGIIGCLFLFAGVACNLRRVSMFSQKFTDMSFGLGNMGLRRISSHGK